MRQVRKLPSREELRQIFDYDAQRGLLIWKMRADRRAQWNGRFAGKVAGGQTHVHGYWVVVLRGFGPLLAHRLIWKWLHDKDPETVDHIDGDPANNRAENLRAATFTENMRNKGPHARKQLPKGVSLVNNTHGAPYRASIYVGKRCVHLGVFHTVEEAHAAYSAAAIRAFGEFACLGRAA